jgi:DNA-binding transcriptional LysR family regulator
VPAPLGARRRGDSRRRRRALIRRGRAVFNKLRQGLEELEFLSNPGAGTLRIGCSEVAAAGIL